MYCLYDAIEASSLGELLANNNEEELQIKPCCPILLCFYKVQ